MNRAQKRSTPSVVEAQGPAALTQDIRSRCGRCERAIGDTGESLLACGDRTSLPQALLPRRGEDLAAGGLHVRHHAVHRGLRSLQCHHGGRQGPRGEERRCDCRWPPWRGRWEGVCLWAWARLQPHRPLQSCGLGRRPCSRPEGLCSKRPGAVLELAIRPQYMRVPSLRFHSRSDPPRSSQAWGPGGTLPP